MGRAIPVVMTAEGIRALSKGKPTPSATVEKYLTSKFGAHLEATEKAMPGLAKKYGEADLNEVAFKLYEQFRPEVPQGEAGWGAVGYFDPEAIKTVKL
jgi:hypothetical protein